MKNKILITGGAGLLGSAWAKRLAHQYETHVTVNHQTIDLELVKNHKINLLKTEAVNDLFHSLKPDIVINTVGLTSVEDCENDPALAQALNVTVTKNISAACKETKARLLHISTDHLFSGRNSMSDEETIVDPVNVYAKSKRDAELFLIKNNPEALILRTNFYGKSIVAKKSFTDWIIGELKNNRPIKMYTDIFFSPIYIQSLITNAMTLAEQKKSGLYNLGSNQRISKYEFGLLVAEVFSLNQKLISPATLLTFPKKVIRPLDMSMSSFKFENATNSKINTITQDLKILREDMEKKL